MAVVLSDRASTGREKLVRPRAPGWRYRVTELTERTYRSLAQIALFAVFGVVGALVTALVVPGYRLAVRDQTRRAAAVRTVVYHLTHVYVTSMRMLRLIDLQVIGVDRMPAPGTLIVANHPSLIDALILLGYVRGAIVVAKRSLQLNPFTSGAIRGADYVVNADALSLIDECRARVAAGQSLVLFPECTRTADDGVIRLQRGAAHIAVRSGCTVIPVTIKFSEPLLTKSSRWWLAPKVRPAVRVTGHAALDPARFLVEDRSVSMAARRLTEHLREFYASELYCKELYGREQAHRESS